MCQNCFERCVCVWNDRVIRIVKVAGSIAVQTSRITKGYYDKCNVRRH